MMKINKLLKLGIPALLWIVYTLPAIAQPVEPPTDEDPLEDPTPIDNWMVLLILAGVVVGIYFFLKYKRKALA